MTCAEDRVVLHDHVHDFLVLESRMPASDVRLRLWELAQEKRRRGWVAFADDSPYLWDRLAWHACRGGLNRRTLREFVSDVDWLAQRIRRQGASAAEQDVGRVCDATALSDTAPLSRLRRVLLHGGLFEAASADAGLDISLTAWADVVGPALVHRGTRRHQSSTDQLPRPGAPLETAARRGSRVRFPSAAPAHGEHDGRVLPQDRPGGGRHTDPAPPNARGVGQVGQRVAVGPPVAQRSRDDGVPGGEGAGR